MRVDRTQSDMPSKAELDLMDEFIRLQRAGKEPDVESFLMGCVEYADSLRPVLESAKWLYQEYQGFKQRNPGVVLSEVLDLN